MKCDYSQIEMRLIANLSGDPQLQKAIESDAHLYIMYVLDKGSDIYGLHQKGYKNLFKRYKAHDPDVVFARDEVKHAGSYGWGYRMGAKTLENTRGIPYQRGKEILRALNQEFHYVTEWWTELEAEVYRTSEGSGYGYLQNEYGRVRNFFLDKNVVPKICNFKPQSLAADILYDAMEELERGLKDFDSELILTVHDEVVIDTPDPEGVAPYIKEVMERPIPELGGLVIPVDIMVGYNWAKYHEHGVSCRGPCSKHENLSGQRPLEEAA
jgi:DNA polymerase-1